MNFPMETIGERIDIILKEKNLKKVEFAEILNIHQSYVTQLIRGRNSPSKRLVEDICEKFDINNDWLCYGKGPMHREKDRDEIIVEWAAKLVKTDNSDFAKKFASILAQLDKHEWEVIENLMIKFVEDKLQKSNQDIE